MGEFLLLLGILAFLGVIALIERRLGKRLDAAEAQDLLPDILHFMQGPEWEEPRSQLEWLVRTRLPMLVREAIQEQPTTRYTAQFMPPWSFIAPAPAVVYDEAVNRILRLVQNLYHEVHTMGGFESSTVARNVIATEYVQHHL